VVPDQLELAGYPRTTTVVITAAASGIGCIFSGLLSNLPFIVAPPTSVTIFFSVYLQEYELDSSNG
jgi:xanthine/uracil/vitamin C permease (AzgA family)